RRAHDPIRRTCGICPRGGEALHVVLRDARADEAPRTARALDGGDDHHRAARDGPACDGPRHADRDRRWVPRSRAAGELGAPGLRDATDRGADPVRGGVPARDAALRASGSWPGARCCRGAAEPDAGGLPDGPDALRPRGGDRPPRPEPWIWAQRGHCRRARRSDAAQPAHHCLRAADHPDRRARAPGHRLRAGPAPARALGADHRNRAARPRRRVGSRLMARTIVLLVFGLAAVATAVTYEKPPIVPAKDIVPAKILAGEGYRIDSHVPTDGLPGP